MDAYDGGVVVLDAAPFELEGAAGGVQAEEAELADGVLHAVGAGGGADVAAALVEAVDSVGAITAGGGDGDVVVSKVGGGVVYGGEEGVEVGLEGGAGRVLELGAAAVDEGVGGGRGRTSEEEEVEEEEEEEEGELARHVFVLV